MSPSSIASMTASVFAFSSSTTSTRVRSIAIAAWRASASRSWRWSSGRTPPVPGMRSAEDADGAPRGVERDVEPLAARERVGAPAGGLVVLPHPGRGGALGRAEVRARRMRGADDEPPADRQEDDHARLELLGDVARDHRQQVVDADRRGELRG